MRVSVIVPVFDPGPDLERCIGSIVGQSIWPGGIEAIFVDDGSTDDTPARLDALAAANANVRVIHTPNSGWPGRPRNVGLDHARGEYVMFVDADDRLGPQALGRMVAVADRNRSDVVVGKIASDFRVVSLGVFRKNRDVCTVHDAPLIDTLTPHKLFRRELLEREGIRYPEGRRRLEDQQFVVRAYFAASTASILADYPCYFYLKRSDRGNLTFEPPEPFGYFADVREVIDIVVAHTEPGPARDRLIRRFVRIEMLRRISEPNLIALGPVDGAQHILAVGPLLREFGTADVLAGVAPLGRVRAALAADGRVDEVIELAERAYRLTARVTTDDVTWDGARFRFSFRAALEDPDGRPLALERRDGRTFLDPALIAGLGTAPDDITGDLGRMRVTVTARHASTHVEWLIPTSTIVETAVVGRTAAGGELAAPTIRGLARLDPSRLAMGHPLDPGAWRLQLRLEMLGLDRRSVLAMPAGASIAGRAVVCIGRPGQIACLLPRGDDPDGTATLMLYAAGDPHAPTITRRARFVARARTLARSTAAPARTALRSRAGRVRRRRTT